MGRSLSTPPDPKSGFDSPAWQGWFSILWGLFGAGNLGAFTVAALPAAVNNGQTAYASNGRKVGEGSGAGTGVPVYYSNGAWRVYSTDAAVAS